HGVPIAARAGNACGTRGARGAGRRPLGGAPSVRALAVALPASGGLRVGAAAPARSAQQGALHRPGRGGPRARRGRVTRDRPAPARARVPGREPAGAAPGAVDAGLGPPGPGVARAVRGARTERDRSQAARVRAPGASTMLSPEQKAELEARGLV